jgi:type I restriction enzyme S subunit
MKSEWKTIRAADFMEFNPRMNLKKGTIATKISMDKLQPYTKKIPETEQAEFSGGTKFSNSDTIMARITPCLENGKTAFVDCLNKDEVAFGSTEFIVLRAKPGVSDAQFVYYLATSPEFRQVAIKSMVGSSGRQRVQQPVLENLELVVPELPKQKRIGGFLAAIDDKIALNAKINDNLLWQAQALYKDRFIDLKPFNGKMPPDWQLGTVSEIIELHDSKRIPLSSRERANLTKIYPYYGATSVMDYVDRYLFDGIYLLLGEDGTVVDDKGFPILQYVEGKFWVNNHAHIITGKNGFTVETLYLLFSLTNVRSIVTGAVQPKISQANLNNVSVVIPSKAELSTFNSIVQPIFSQIRNLRAESDRLTSTRDILLPRLMSGEIDAANIQL